MIYCSKENLLKRNFPIKGRTLMYPYFALNAKILNDTEDKSLELIFAISSISQISIKFI